MPTSTRRYAPAFSEIFGKFETSQWGDVGIAPYGSFEVFREVRRGRCPHRPKDTIEFAEDYRKNGAVCRGDVLNRPLRSVGKAAQIPVKYSERGDLGEDGVLRLGHCLKRLG